MAFSVCSDSNVLKLRAQAIIVAYTARQDVKNVKGNREKPN